MFILYAIPIGIVIGLLAGGRIGQLGELHLRWVPLILLGLAVQVAIFTDAVGRAVGDAGPAIYAASTALVFVAVLRNVQVPGVALIAVGAGCNLAAIVANGGWMPADPRALAAILYDWDSATIFGDPLPSVWSADGTDKDVPDRLDEAALEAAGRHAIALQVEEATASGLSATAWLPSEKGTGALLKFGQEHGAIAIVVPAEFGDLPENGSTIQIVRS